VDHSARVYNDACTLHGDRLVRAYGTRAFGGGELRAFGFGTWLNFDVGLALRRARSNAFKCGCDAGPRPFPFAVWFLGLLSVAGTAVLGYRAFRTPMDLRHAARLDAISDLAIALTVMLLDSILPAMTAFVVYFAAIHSVEHYAGLYRSAKLKGQVQSLVSYSIVFSLIAAGMALLLLGSPLLGHKSPVVEAGVSMENRGALWWMVVYFAAFTFPHLALLSTLRLRGGGRAFGAATV
jgi:hypothetical protein